MQPRARRAGALAALGIAVGLAVAASFRDRDSTPVQGADAPVLGLLSPSTPPSMLARLDPLALAARPGRRVRLLDTVAPSFSPDGSRLLLGGQSLATVSFIDVRLMRRLGRPVLLPGERVEATVWPAPSRALALTTALERRCVPLRRLVIIDPVKRRILRARVVKAGLVGQAVTRGGLALLEGPRSSIGPARLELVGATGNARSVLLKRISAGARLVAPNGCELRRPSLVIDGTKERAFVLGGTTVAEIDLSSLRVQYHTPLFSRGPALWAGEGKIAATRLTTGLVLLDTHDWAVRTVDASASSFWVGAGRLFVESRQRLVAYDLAGSRRYERFAGRQPDPHLPLVERLQTLGNRAYVAFSPQPATDNSRRYAVLDLSSGRVLREVDGEMPVLISGR